MAKWWSHQESQTCAWTLGELFPISLRTFVSSGDGEFITPLRFEQPFDCLPQIQLYGIGRDLLLIG